VSIIALRVSQPLPDISNFIRSDTIASRSVSLCTTHTHTLSTYLRRFLSAGHFDENYLQKFNQLRNRSVRQHHHDSVRFEIYRRLPVTGKPFVHGDLFQREPMHQTFIDRHVHENVSKTVTIQHQRSGQRLETFQDDTLDVQPFDRTRTLQ